MKTLNVDLGERSYPIHIGGGLLDNVELLAPHLRSHKVLIVTNDTVAPLFLDRMRKTLAAYDVSHVTVADGERFKTLDTVNTIYGRLLQRNLDRQATLIALGGGVIGDMTGFAAATYQRGIDFIQIPTTLLAQVDSSVGGKTGVNHRLGKNMIGAFHQPRCVLIDIETLKTLPEREFRAGLAEVIKYGLIDDPGFFDWLEQNIDHLLELDADALSHAIERSCQDKAAVVAADEREAGQRALLNLGHTFGHAIETDTGYTQWLHGEAVALGIAMAADLSVRLGWLPDDQRQRIERLLQAAGLPTRGPRIAPERFRQLMAVDKKVLAGKLRLVLLKGIGRGVVADDFDQAALTATLEHYAS